MRPRFAVAVALVGLALQGPGVARAGGGEDSAWARLDAEIAALAAAPAEADGRAGLRGGAVLRTSYAWFEETPVVGSTGTYSGFALDDARPWFEGRVGATTVRLELEAQDGDVRLLDAFARVELAAGLQATVGRFQTELLRSALVEPRNLLFLTRTASGQRWQDARDDGVQVDGRFENLRVAAALQNGGDGAADDSALSVRAELDALGGGVLPSEGAWGSGRKTCLSLGLGWHDDDGGTGDGSVLAADLAATTDRLAIYAEWLDYGDSQVHAQLADTSPWSVTGSFMIDKDKFELAVRYEQADDADDTRTLTIGLNRYLVGHDVKWLANFADIARDGSSPDGTAFGLGLTASL